MLCVSGLDRLDQEAAGVRDEGSVPLDPVVQLPQSVLEALDAEAGDDPHDEPEEVHDRADVVEGHPQPLGSGCPGPPGRRLRPPAAARRGSRSDDAGSGPSSASLSSRTLCGPTCCEK